MPQALEYSELALVDDDDVLNGVVDVSDSTHDATGTTKYCTRTGLFGGPRVKTATELSSTSALQDYVDDSLGAFGVCQLPPGVIDITGTINITKRQGGIIRGCGFNPMPTYDTGNGFNNPSLSTRYSTIIRRSTGSAPIFDLDGAFGLTLENFGLETDGVAIHYNSDNSPAYPSSYGLFRRLSFAPKTDGDSGGTAIQAGTAIGDTNAADLEIHGCNFHRLVNGLLVKHNQGVNYHFTGNNWFAYCDNAIHLEGGGCVVADMLSGFGVKTWLRAITGGGNLRTNLLKYIYSDRSAGDRPPVIVDFNGCTGSMAAIVDAVKITYHADDADDWPDHYAFLLPAAHVANNVDIITNNTAAWTQPGGTSWTPTVAANPFD